MQTRILKNTCTALIASAMLVASARPDSNSVAPAHTHVSSTEPAPPQSLRSYLEKLEYDDDERGPLLAVAPDEPVNLSPDESAAATAHRLSLATLARLTERKVAIVGGIRVLVPLTMKLIESHPGKANPYRGMSKEDSIQFLMGTFTRDQLQTACSPEGIGLGDLTEDQKRFMVGMLPGKVALYTIPADSGTPGLLENIPVPEPENVRLRLNLLAHYSTPGDSDISDGSGGEIPEAGGHVGLLFRSDRWRAADGLDDHSTAAFGVRLIRIVPNRQKLSQIDYSWPQLDPTIGLGDLGRPSTIGDAIERIARATRLDIVCDRRASRLPIFVRGVSGRAGDLLQAIALAVTGTYRKVGATSAYVLTDDIEGMGARAARIGAWANRAYDERKRLLDAAAARAAKLDPLSYLNFAPHDPLTLPSGIKDSLLAEYRKGADDDDIEQLTKTSDLPSAYRADINRNYEAYQSAHGTGVDISNVKLGMDVSMTFLIPGVGPVLDPLNRAENDMRRLVELPRQESAAQSSAAPPNWKWLSDPRQKRVLLIAPRNILEATNLTEAAGRHGFTDVWLKVDAGLGESLETKGGPMPAARGLLETAIAAGTRAHVAVGADVSLLQNDNKDVLERNIFGQTGEEFAAACVAQPAKMPSETPTDASNMEASDHADDNPKEHFGNWRSPDVDVITRRISAIADIAGLSGIVLQQTAPPGFIHDDDEDSPVPPGGELGFTDSRRFAFLHKAGFDPIDVIRENGDLGEPDLDEIDLALPFFSDNGKAEKYAFEGGTLKDKPIPESPRQLWDQFLASENSQFIDTVYKSFRALLPTMPLWIDDRTSDFANVAPWFGTLDDPARLPRHPADKDKEDDADLSAARAASKTVLFCARPPMTGPYATRSDAFISEMGARSVAENWDGIVVDLTRMPAKSALNLLQNIPEAKPSAGIRSAPDIPSLHKSD